MGGHLQSVIFDLEQKLFFFLGSINKWLWTCVGFFRYVNFSQNGARFKKNLQM